LTRKSNSLQSQSSITEHFVASPGRTGIPSRGGTVYHPTSTCKMGSDPMAGVDAELRVHGIDRLRVADASIMPTVVSGNTNAATIMIGEKLADMVRQQIRLAE